MDHTKIQEFARERHLVYLRRKAGLPREEWTEDYMLQNFRFTNVYRELDRVTVWCREHVREPLIQSPNVLLATTVFRWFNKIETGQAIFDQTRLDTNPPGATAWDELVASGSTEAVRSAVLSARGKGPYVTGAYIIKTPNGYDKLSGVLQCIDWFNTKKFVARDIGEIDQLGFASALVSMEGSYPLQDAYDYLAQFPYLGSFMAAQLIADLKYTDMLSGAPDWHTFAASGPGSRRGLNIVCGRDPESSWRPKEWHEQLLELRERISPMFVSEGWEVPHAQDVQNICCEWSKYTRGFSRQRFK